MLVGLLVVPAGAVHQAPIWEDEGVDLDLGKEFRERADLTIGVGEEVEWQLGTTNWTATIRRGEHVVTLQGYAPEPIDRVLISQETSSANTTQLST